MRAGMRSLLTLLRGEPLDGIPEPEWMTALDLAEQENVLPWTATSLSAAGPWGPQLTERLREIHRNAQVAAFLWSASLKSTLEEFHNCGIPVIALKGPSLAERLYGDPALRTYCDLDLLVRRSDLHRAMGLLSALGFTPTGRQVDNEQAWQRTDIRIDLHHDAENPLFFDFHINEVWQNARCADFHRVPVCLLAPADELLFLCLHGVRHRFERLSHVLDSALAFRRWQQHFDLLGQRSPAADAVLALAIRMAARLDPRVSVSDPASLSEHNRTALDSFASQLWQVLLDGPVPAGDWLAKHRFFLTLETHFWHRQCIRLRHLRVLLTRLIDSDFAFAARFNLHRDWQVWLLRPIRLVLKVARASTLSLASIRTETSISPKRN
jgi:Uncharacterised nucleotidyltransferase